MPTPSIAPHVTIVHHVLDSVTDVLIAVGHAGVDHHLLVSVERAQPSESAVTIYPEPSIADVPMVCQRASRRARVRAVRALVAGDTARYRLLSAVEVGLHNYGAAWAEAIAEEGPEGEEVRAS
jgi:hypothetical protein